MIYPPPSKPAPAPATALPLRAGPGARVSQTPFGQSATVRTGSKWRHPWFTKLTWLAAAKQWVATVRPGFVNGQLPVVVVTPAEQDSIEISGGYDFGVNPVTGEKFSRVYVFNLNKTITKGAPITQYPIPLSYNPAIPLRWSNLGWDGDATVPSFFQDRGVHLPPAGLSADAVLNGELQNTADMAPPKGNRLLRSASIILHQPRVALTSTITLEPGIVTGLSNAMQTLGLRSAAPGDQLKVFSGAMIDANAAAFDPLSDDYEEPNFDELLLSTVYLLSPPNAAPGSEPDSTWQPFVKHELFWNLTYITPEFVISTADLNNAFASLTSIASVLGEGTGSIAVNFVAADLNDQAARALNMINAHSMAGAFYTATGGGSTTMMPAVASVATAASLDKAANAAASLAAKRAKQNASLDPAFPFEARQFPVSYLAQG